MNYLLAVSIGPVQDFIASARRSRDLWFGSWLLSELSKAAARAIADREENVSCLIFPSPGEEDGLLVLEPESEFNVANKIVAIIREEVWQGSDGALELKGVQDAVGKRLDDIRRDAFSQANIPGRYFDSETATEQVSDLFEFAWAAAPLPDGPDDYQRARDAVERLLAARKTTRDFKPVSWGSGARKSSFDGARESVIDEEVYRQVRRGELSEFELRRNYGIRPGERLCGVALLKRHGRRGRENRVLSTSHVAAGPLLARLGEKHSGAVEELKKGLADAEADLKDHSRVPEAHKVFGRLDAHILYAERLNEIVPEDGLTRAKQALDDFFKATGLPRPGSYYGLLLADGDWMGAAIDAQETPEAHRALSGRLTEFAASAPGIVRKAGGSLIYAGGDDVLAFLPLHTALNCARQLADLFVEKLSGFTFDKEGRSTSPTLSAGLCVAHHLSPLSDALELARRAEKRAKVVEGKGALAIIVDKRSGTSREVAGRWGELDDRLRMFADWHVADEVPDGAAFQLRDVALRLAGVSPPPEEDRELLDLAGRYEAVRILGRKRAGGGSRAMESKVLSFLSELLLIKDSMPGPSPATAQADDSHVAAQSERDEIKPGPLSVAALADELIVARVFAEAVATAGAGREEACQ